MRDEHGCFMLAKTECFSLILNIDNDEAFGLLIAMQWIRDLHLTNVDFKLNYKNMVSKCQSKGDD